MRTRLPIGIGLRLLIISFCFSWHLNASLLAGVDDLQVASFNIQVFGQSKMKKDPVVATLINILDRYDLIFIMEIRDIDNLAIFELLARLNQQSTKNFQLILSKRLGRTISKEQYAFFYNPDKVNPDQSYVYDDVLDQFEREPYIAHFRTSTKNFTILGIHTTPRDVKAELKALGPVYHEAKTRLNESNIYIVGDLNADCTYYHPADGFQYFDDPALLMIPEKSDTTVANTYCNYDRVLAFGEIIKATSKAKIFDFQSSYSLTQEEARRVSDHFPVEWSIDLSPSFTPEPGFAGSNF